MGKLSSKIVKTQLKIRKPSSKSGKTQFLRLLLSVRNRVRCTKDKPGRAGVTFYVIKVALFRPKVTFLLHKSYTLPTEEVDGSNESLYYPDEELGPYLKTGSLL